MIMHGIKKLVYGHDFVITKLSEFLWLGVPVGEVIAPIGLILGIFSRSSSLLVAFTMFMTFYLVFGWNGLALNQYGGFNGGYNLFFLFTALAIYLAGPGKYSLSEKTLQQSAKTGQILDTGRCIIRCPAFSAFQHPEIHLQRFAGFHEFFRRRGVKFEHVVMLWDYKF